MYQSAKRKPIADRPAATGPAGPAGPAPVQRAAAPAPYHALPASVGLTAPNRTGLPNGLKSGIETLSGLSMDDVRVHRGSSRPATVQAEAYTQGSEIHLAPGQERHLPHEAWHVVQQKQGRVRPSFDLNGTSINDDAGLEHEADRMGQRAERTGGGPAGSTAPVQRAGIATPVVQRSVLHIQNDEGDFVYYSDLEVVPRGKRLTTFASRKEAQKFDEKLAGNSGVLAKAITTSQNRDRRVPTPYGHANTLPTAKVRHQDQGPHSLSFIAFEERLQHRLAKGQHLELLDQVETPERAISLMQSEYGLGDDSDVLKRYGLDYRSLYDEFVLLLKSDVDHGIGSRFHLVARKLLQLNPYTTYNGPKSTNRGEDRHGILGSNTLDSKAKYKSQLEYETYLQTRGDLFHSSDEEDEDQKPKEGGTPYTFSSISPRERRYSRKSKAESKKRTSSSSKSKISIEDDSSSSSSSSSSDERRPTKKPRDRKAVAQEDTVKYFGHRFNPNTVGIRDGGECFWDTMRHYGFTEKQLSDAASEAGLTVDVAVDARDIAAFVDALNEEVDETIWVRLVTYDLKTLKFQSYIDIGDGDKQVYVALFADDDQGHYVPEL
ncbi:DUF4157 domain-containing protein [Sphingomonas sp. IBVSS2]|uniref:eCIS core domain-containing protein n=1 Tax=Sphingomonas sp. IBVSS2 TaxID=1985172 RepID=UPI001C53079A|nr:DUF4157 domain-containing protein [Sphingomonas sp. IBVSS2]